MTETEMTEFRRDNGEPQTWLPVRLSEIRILYSVICHRLLPCRDSVKAAESCRRLTRQHPLITATVRLVPRTRCERQGNLILSH